MGFDERRSGESGATGVVVAILVLFTLGAMLLAGLGVVFYTRSQIRAEQALRLARQAEMEARQAAEAAPVQAETIQRPSITAPPPLVANLPVTADTILQPGIQLLAMDRDQWVAVQVVEVFADQRVRVRWVGSPTDREETLPRERLRLPQVPEASQTP